MSQRRSTHVPSLRLVALAIIPTTASLGLLLRPELLLPLVVLDSIIVLIAVGDLLWSSCGYVSISREAPEVMSLARPNAVVLKLRSTAKRPLAVMVNDDLFEAAECTELPGGMTLAAQGAGIFRYRIYPNRRGAYRLGDHWLRYPSVLGLWQCQQRIQASQDVRVYPDLQNVRAFELLARQNRELRLVRAIRLAGGETEFSRLREYSRDDEYRAVDWKATARRQQLIAREYQLESDQSIVFMLDAGRLMTKISSGLSHFDHALNATLMAAHVASRTGDKVGMLGFDSSVRAFVSPTGGFSAGARLIRAAYDLHPRLVESNYEDAFARLRLAQRKRALVVLFTEVVDDAVATTLVRQMRALRKWHLPMLVLFRDTEVEALVEPNNDSDEELYVRGAAAELLRWRGSVIAEMRRAGALVLDAKPAGLTTKLVNSYLQVKAHHLL